MLRWILILILLPAGLFSFPEQPHHTSAYISDPGEIDILISFSSYSTDHFWNKHGKKLPTFNHFRSENYPVYIEYAINCRNSFIFNGAYTMVHETLNGKTQAVNEAEAGWKMLLWSPGTAALSSLVTIIVPAGEKKASIRYGKAGAEFSLLYSDIFCLLGRYGWYDLKAGYRWYRDFPSDRVVVEAALGYAFNYRLQLIATANLDYGVFNGDDRHIRNNVIQDPNYRLFKAKIECVLRVITNVSISVGYYQHIWGQNVGTGGGFVGGTWIDF